MENELAQNGLSSFVRAALTNEIDYQANYRSDDPRENFALVARELGRGGGTFTRLDLRGGSTALLLRAQLGSGE